MNSNNRAVEGSTLLPAAKNSPPAGVGGEESWGTLYSVGAWLSCTLGGVENTLNVIPDTIRVMPMPVLDYFLSVSVPCDDPHYPGKTIINDKITIL